MPKVNLGRKESERYGSMIDKPSAKNKIYYPDLYVEQELPISGKTKEIDVLVRLKVKSIKKNVDVVKGQNKFEYRFDVLSMAFPYKSGTSSKKDTPDSTEGMIDKFKNL